MTQSTCRPAGISHFSLSILANLSVSLGFQFGNAKKIRRQYVVIFQDKKAKKIPYLLVVEIFVVIFRIFI